MTTEVARCGIYEDRPQVCRDYPKIDHYRPTQCTYCFIDNKKLGKCDCGIGACCKIPRENGEPGGTPLPEIAGGEPCKHLVVESEKTASLPIYDSRSKEIEGAI